MRLCGGYHALCHYLRAPGELGALWVDPPPRDVPGGARAPRWRSRACWAPRRRAPWTAARWRRSSSAADTKRAAVATVRAGSHEDTTATATATGPTGPTRPDRGLAARGRLVGAALGLCRNRETRRRRGVRARDRGTASVREPGAPASRRAEAGPRARRTALAVARPSSSRRWRSCRSRRFASAPRRRRRCWSSGARWRGTCRRRRRRRGRTAGRARTATPFSFAATPKTPRRAATAFFATARTERAKAPIAGPAPDDPAIPSPSRRTRGRAWGSFCCSRAREPP